MERLSDVLDQQPEFQVSTDNPQIPLPAVKGNVDLKMLTLGSLIRVHTKSVT